VVGDVVVGDGLEYLWLGMLWLGMVGNISGWGGDVVVWEGMGCCEPSVVASSATFSLSSHSFSYC
jgi:hypothetical protein